MIFQNICVVILVMNFKIFFKHSVLIFGFAFGSMNGFFTKIKNRYRLEIDIICIFSFNWAF